MKQNSFLIKKRRPKISLFQVFFSFRGKKIQTGCAACLLFCLTLTLCCGCSPKTVRDVPLAISGFAFNTTYTFTFYEGGDQELLNTCVEKCSEYEQIFSRTQEGSELYRVNQISRIYRQVWQRVQNVSDADGMQSWHVPFAPRVYKKIKKELTWELAAGNLSDLPVTLHKNGEISIHVSKTLADILKQGLYYSKLSDGHFDISIAPVSSLWDFTAENPVVPTEQTIKEALQYINYRKIALQKETLSFAIPGMQIDLGGIAKGYIADAMKEYLQKKGVKRGVINLGGNILCIGQRSESEPFHIGIQQPFADRNQTIASVRASDSSIVSSGIYERYFKGSDGTIYHHILNPKTGYPCDNGLISVTILSKRSVDGDGLSTTVFTLGLDKGLELINAMDGVEALLITQDEKMHYSNNFKKYLI